MNTALHRNDKKRRIKLDSKLVARILVVILAFSMLAGTFYYIFLSASINSRAEGQKSVYNPNIRVAIVYDSTVEADVDLHSETGFEIGYTNSGSVFTHLTNIPNKDVNVARHYNLTFNGTKYVKASSESSTTVGSFHIKIKSTGNIETDLAEYKKAFPEQNVFTAILDEEFYIMVGQFVSVSKANEGFEALKKTSGASALPKAHSDAFKAAEVISPFASSMVVIDPATNKIVLLYNHTNANKPFAIGATKTDDSTSFFKCYHKRTASIYTTRTYSGYFECSATSSGIKVIDLLPLETYLVGVVSAEIPTHWPIETLKAFAVAARSYAATCSNHSSINAAICNTSHCQVFNGFGPANDRTWRAVDETAGIIAVSGNKICGTYYSSSTGGCTANCTDVWGSSLQTFPYLKAVATPWEKYETYSKGTLKTTVTATALYDRLVDQGYTTLKSKVSKVEITKTGNNTTYVTEIKFYDQSGNCLTINRADKIKKALGSYVNSSNFVVAKSGESVKRINYTMLGFGGISTENSKGVSILTNPTKYNIVGRQNFSVITSGGIKTFSDSTSEKVITSSGIVDFNMAQALDTSAYHTITGINGEVLPDMTKLNAMETVETIQTDAAADSFTFISRGWGHGVGMSQYGIYELGNLGYDYQTILKAYYSGISFTTYGEYLGLS